jgi:antitoxin MazE
MRVAKWGNSLAIRLPAHVVDALELQEGSEIEIRMAGDRTFEVSSDQTRDRALERIRTFQKKLPPDWKFDRDDANAR